MIHELFHAFMDDYNRAGMSGTETVKGMLTDDKGYFIDKEVEKKYPYLHFPNWFIEGTASATENIYEFRIGSFKDYRYNQKDGYYDKYTAENVANSYTYGNDSSGKFAYYDLIYKDGGEDSAGDPIDTVNCCYVSGYLATLFLSELAYQKKTGYLIMSM